MYIFCIYFKLCQLKILVYSFENREKLLKYTHHIRNMKPLNRDMIENVCRMSSDEKMNMILALNDMLIHLVDIMNDNFSY
jgi:hypothetical protein